MFIHIINLKSIGTHSEQKSVGIEINDRLPSTLKSDQPSLSDQINDENSEGDIKDSNADEQIQKNKVNNDTRKDEIINNLKAQMHQLILQNQHMHGAIEGMQNERGQAQMIINDMKGKMDAERSASHHKLTYLMREKQDAHDRIQQYEDAISKYARMIEQMQMNMKMDKDKIITNHETFKQQKMIEDELRIHIEAIQYKLRESDASLRSQTEEIYNIKAENQNLKADLKSLISIEQALRAELAKVGQKSLILEDQAQQMIDKITEDHHRMQEIIEENENLRRNLIQYHKVVEAGSNENHELK